MCPFIRSFPLFRLLPSGLGITIYDNLCTVMLCTLTGQLVVAYVFEFINVLKFSYAKI